MSGLSKHLYRREYNNSSILSSAFVGRNFLVCTILFLLGGILRAVFSATDIIWAYNGLHVMIYLGILFEWLYSIRVRFINKEVRRYLTIVAVLMVFWFVVRIIKYDFVAEDSLWIRYLWYVYYIPFTLTPVFMFMAVLHVGKNDRYEIDKRWKLIYIPTVAVAAGILTNDLHQLAFGFREDMVNWNIDYSHGVLYFLALAILVLSLLGIMFRVFYICSKQKFFKSLWLPAGVMIVGIIYELVYTTTSIDDKAVIQHMYEFPEFICFFLIVFFESLVITHLIPYNSGHETFFRNSAIYAGLTDEDYNICLSAYGDPMKALEDELPTPEQIHMAEESPLLFGDVLLKSHPVSGGHFFWLEDVEDLLQINRKLEETVDYLNQEHEVLDASAKLSEEHRRMKEENLLYDHVAKSLQPQLDRLEGILNDLPEDEEEFRARMRYAGVLNAYIKRRSNLLLEGGDKMLDSGELKIAIEELMSYVRLNGIECFADVVTGVDMPVLTALKLFEMLECVIEEGILDMTHIMVVIKRDGSSLSLVVTVSPCRESFSDGWINDFKKRYSDDADIDVSCDDDEIFVTCCFFMGGDRN